MGPLRPSRLYSKGPEKSPFTNWGTCLSCATAWMKDASCTSQGTSNSWTRGRFTSAGIAPCSCETPYPEINSPSFRFEKGLGQTVPPEIREIAEQIIDRLYAASGLKRKPRTYRQKARKDYLSLAKQRRASAKARRKGIKKQ